MADIKFFPNRYLPGVHQPGVVAEVDRLTPQQAEVMDTHTDNYGATSIEIGPSGKYREYKFVDTAAAGKFLHAVEQDGISLEDAEVSRKMAAAAITKVEEFSSNELRAFTGKI